FQFEESTKNIALLYIVSADTNVIDNSQFIEMFNQFVRIMQSFINSMYDNKPKHEVKFLNSNSITDDLEILSNMKFLSEISTPSVVIITVKNHTNISRYDNLYTSFGVPIRRVLFHKSNKDQVKLLQNLEDYSVDKWQIHMRYDSQKPSK